MAEMGFRLAPEDDYPHTPDAEKNYNESVYANAFDATSGLGGWMRLGNRVHEGAAELSVCLYLPDGRVACRFDKPAISSNDKFEAGGFAYAVQKPLEAISMHYEGPLFVIDPELLRRPKDAFDPKHRVPCVVDWQQATISPVHGGEPKSDAQPTAYGRNFSRGHLNLHTQVTGHIKIGDQDYPFSGFGWRDHSWGPRYWQNLYGHRLLTANFGPGSALMIHKIEDEDGTVRRIGTILEGDRYEDVGDLDLAIHWNERREPTGADIRFRTAARRGAVKVTVRTLAPLRNRREHEGKVLEARILEASAGFEFEGKKGFGMFELVERLENGKLSGYPL